MTEYITIKKSMFLLAGLLLALIAGVYLFFMPPSLAQGNAAQVAQANTSIAGSAPSNPAYQDIYIRAQKDGSYDQLEIKVKQGVPVRLHFTADPEAGCGRMLVIYGLDVKALSIDGAEEAVEFTPKDAGSYEYSCGMHMWGPGRLVVV